MLYDMTAIMQIATWAAKFWMWVFHWVFLLIGNLI